MKTLFSGSSFFSFATKKIDCETSKKAT